MAHPGSGGIDLDVGARDVGARLTVLGCGGVIAFVVMAITGTGAITVWTSPDNRSSVVGVVLGTVCAVFTLMLASSVIGGVGIVRFSARLNGTTLEVRRALTTRRVDLARAPQVWTEKRPVKSRGAYVAPIPILWARGESGRRVPLPLHTRYGTWLPPAQLVALADAIEAGHRPEPAASQVRPVVAALRAVADDPRGPLI